MELKKEMLITGYRTVAIKALSDSISLPAFILLTTMAGFGALAQTAGFSVGMAALSTVLVWGLPGQVAMAELASEGIVVAVVACSLANARFLPMTVTFLPLITTGIRHNGFAYLLAQLLSINSWAMCLRMFPLIDPTWRRHYYVCFASSILLAAVTGTIVGFHISGSLPMPALISLIFLSPLFFALLLIGMKGQSVRLAMTAGVLLMPIAHSFFPDMDLFITGVLGGSCAFFLARSGFLKQFKS